MGNVMRLAGTETAAFVMMGFAGASVAGFGLLARRRRG